MGVKDLWSILSPVMTPVTLADLRGQTLAVDLSIWVVETQGVRQMQGVVTKPYLRNLFFRTNHLLQLGINLIFVIEGEAPELKWETMAQRTQVRYGGRGRGRGQSMPTRKPKRSHFKTITNECCRMLDEMGVPYVQSAGEAEAMCALLNSQGVVDGCLTDDGDVFLYGARRVYRNFTMNNKDPHVESYDMADVERHLALSRHNLVALSLLLGCDYIPKGVPGVRRETALKFFKQLGQDDALKRFDSWIQKAEHYARLQAISSTKKVPHCNQCKHPGSARDHERRGCAECGSSKLCDPQPYDYVCRCDWHQKQERVNAVSDELSIQKKAVITPGFPWPKVVDEFLITKDKVPKKVLRWKCPRLLPFMSFCELKMEWERDYSREKLLPLLTLWEIRAQLGIHDRGKYPSIAPHSIVKTRVRQGTPCFEIHWQKLEEDIGFADEFYTTIEEAELIGSCYPILVEIFEATKPVKTSRKKAKASSQEHDKENVDVNSLTTAMEDVQISDSQTQRKCKVNKKPTKKPPLVEHEGAMKPPAYSEPNVCRKVKRDDLTEYNSNYGDSTDRVGRTAVKIQQSVPENIQLRHSEKLKENRPDATMPQTMNTQNTFRCTDISESNKYASEELSQNYENKKAVPPNDKPKTFPVSSSDESSEEEEEEYLPLSQRLAMMSKVNKRSSYIVSAGTAAKHQSKTNTSDAKEKSNTKGRKKELEKSTPVAENLRVCDVEAPEGKVKNYLGHPNETFFDENSTVLDEHFSKMKLTESPNNLPPAVSLPESKSLPKSSIEQSTVVDENLSKKKPGDSPNDLPQDKAVVHLPESASLLKCASKISTIVEGSLSKMKPTDSLNDLPQRKTVMHLPERETLSKYSTGKTTTVNEILPKKKPTDSLNDLSQGKTVVRLNECAALPNCSSEKSNIVDKSLPKMKSRESQNSLLKDKQVASPSESKELPQSTIKKPGTSVTQMILDDIKPEQDESENSHRMRKSVREDDDVFHVRESTSSVSTKATTVKHSEPLPHRKGKRISSKTKRKPSKPWYKEAVLDFSSDDDDITPSFKKHDEAKTEQKAEQKIAVKEKEKCPFELEGGFIREECSFSEYAQDNADNRDNLTDQNSDSILGQGGFIRSPTPQAKCNAENTPMGQEPSWEEPYYSNNEVLVGKREGSQASSLGMNNICDNVLRIKDEQFSDRTFTDKQRLQSMHTLCEYKTRAVAYIESPVHKSILCTSASESFDLFENSGVDDHQLQPLQADVHAKTPSTNNTSVNTLENERVNTTPRTIEAPNFGPGNVSQQPPATGKDGLVSPSSTVRTLPKKEEPGFSKNDKCYFDVTEGPASVFVDTPFCSPVGKVQHIPTTFSGIQRSDRPRNIKMDNKNIGNVTWNKSQIGNFSLGSSLLNISCDSVKGDNCVRDYSPAVPDVTQLTCTNDARPDISVCPVHYSSPIGVIKPSCDKNDKTPMDMRPPVSVYPVQYNSPIGVTKPGCDENDITPLEVCPGVSVSPVHYNSPIGVTKPSCDKNDKTPRKVCPGVSVSPLHYSSPTGVTKPGCDKNSKTPLEVCPGVSVPPVHYSSPIGVTKPSCDNTDKSPINMHPAVSPVHHGTPIHAITTACNKDDKTPLSKVTVPDFSDTSACAAPSPVPLTQRLLNRIQPGKDRVLLTQLSQPGGRCKLSQLRPSTMNNDSMLYTPENETRHQGNASRKVMSLDDSDVILVD